MENKNKNRIIPQMFDVKPVDKSGNLDLEKINKIEKTLSLRKVSGIRPAKRIDQDLPKKKVNLVQLGQSFDPQEIPIRYQFDGKDFLEAKRVLEDGSKEEPKRKQEKPKRIKSIHFTRDYLSLKKNAFQFALACFLVFLLTLSPVLIGRGLGVRDASLKNGEEALVKLAQAKESFSQMDFQTSIGDLQEAQKKFEEISKNIDSLGFVLVESAQFFPKISKLTSGKYLAEAGEKATQIGIIAANIAKSLNQIENPIEGTGEVSLLDIFQDATKNLSEILDLSQKLEKDLQKISVEDLPEDKRGVFVEIKNQLPSINTYLASFIEESKILGEVLGGQGPRKYLFLFQNNNEMRATGGFIGTYALLDIFEGRIKKLVIDGIFNPDGQLKEKVVPPQPIQKISAAWSLHDSNWWPDFPVSAEKAIWFWEKTGGPTVDGVIAMTPQVLKSFLEITGPIEMPEYGKTIDENNFLEEVQQEVEVDYDKDLNQPKKILADLAPKILDKIFNTRNPKKLSQVLSILGQDLSQKHILLYSTNFNVEKLIKEKGFSGEVLETQGDYLSVINTNINGYKTDGVIDESIEHQAQIQEDGSIIDTVTIKRHHSGGNSSYEWFNKVNANYQRVYVPQGSQLISVEGQTREFNDPPLDYKALSFKVDSQVMTEEQNMKIDEKSGTRIYQDGNKTVFANWNYVSPQETSVITYQYRLPFKVNLEKSKSGIDTYSLLAQKQSGSLGSDFSSKIILPENWKINWKYPESNFKKEGNVVKFESDLKTDKFIGLALEK